MTCINDPVGNLMIGIISLGVVCQAARRAVRPIIGSIRRKSRLCWLRSGGVINRIKCSVIIDEIHNPKPTIFQYAKMGKTTSPSYLIILTELLLPWEIGMYRGRLEAKLHSKSPFQTSNFRLKWFSMSFLISILITLDTKRMVCIFYMEVLDILDGSIHSATYICISNKKRILMVATAH